MKSASFSLLLASILASSSLIAQKLKKADRSIVSNIQAHINFLSGNNPGDAGAGSDSEKRAADYIRKNFERFGLHPKGDPDSWFQSFEIYDGKDVLSSSYLNINNHNLLLYTDYFPFAFSAVKKTEGTVTIALSESGYPWFKDISDITEDGQTAGDNIGKLVINKAKQAASKGATALIIYNTSQKDLSFDALDSSAVVSIPVLYITKDAFKKYCKDESAMVDVKLNIAMQTKR
ncbi:MAG: hypothetical protein J7497_04695, partial [Chitinophagaceae bacterium]|nr:hypothetical protein [Chitinophagaceae bacterium]